MLKDENGRAVLHCDRCAVKLDLGPTKVVRNRQPFRMPTGWFVIADDRHQCPQHDFAGAQH